MVRKRNVLSLTLDLNSINPADIKGSGFDINKNVEEAKSYLENYQDYRVKKVSVDFEYQKWVFKEEFTRSEVVFDYTIISDTLRFGKADNKEELLVAVKCWIAKKINERSIMDTKAKLMNLVSAFLSTKGLRETNLLLEMMHEGNLIRKGSIKNQFIIQRVSNNVMYKFITHLVDFIEFYNRDEFVHFLNDLCEYKAKIKLKNQYRELPSFKDILTIKQCFR